MARQDSREKMLTLLRKGPMTVQEFGEKLGLGENAVRVHLMILQRDGLVEQVGARKGTRKPHHLFGLTHSGEQAFAKAYGLLVHELVTALKSNSDESQTEAIYRAVGQRLSQRMGLPPKRGFSERMHQAVSALRSIGADAEVHEQDNCTVVKGSGCPIAMAVSADPRACTIALALLSDIIGEEVVSLCSHGDRPSCHFVLQRCM